MSIEYALKCPVCGTDMEVRLARGRRSGKAFIMALCTENPRHLRAFINDKAYVAQVLERLEAKP